MSVESFKTVQNVSAIFSVILYSEIQINKRKGSIMAKYRNVNTGFWTDTKVLEHMPRDEKFFLLMLLTNPNTNQVGCYELGLRQMEIFSTLERKDVEKCIKSLTSLGIIEFSPETSEVLIINWHKYNWTASSSVKKCIQTEFAQVKNRRFRRILLDISAQKDYGLVAEKNDLPANAEADSETASPNEADLAKPEVAETASPLRKYIAENCPRVAKNFAGQELTQKQLSEINAVYSGTMVKKTLDNLENYKELDSYKSLYLTLKDWLNRTDEYYIKQYKLKDLLWLNHTRGQFVYSRFEGYETAHGKFYRYANPKEPVTMFRRCALPESA